MRDDFSPVDPALWSTDKAIHQISMWKCALDRIAHLMDPAILQEAHEALSNVRNNIQKRETATANSSQEGMPLLQLH